MGFLIAAAQSASNEELSNALRGVRTIGKARRSGTWWWTLVFHLHLKELSTALGTYEACSLAAYAGDGIWKLSLFGMGEPPLSLWFDGSLSTPDGLGRSQRFYEGNSLKLAKQFGLAGEDQKLFRNLPFEDAVLRLQDSQLRSILDGLQRFAIPHDPMAIREILLKPTAEELDSELGNLPRFLEAIGITGILE